MEGQVKILSGHRKFNGKTGIAKPCPNWQGQYGHEVLLNTGERVSTWEYELKQERM